MAGAALAVALVAAGMLIVADGDAANDTRALGTYSRHKAAVRALAVAADGTLAASGDAQGEVRIWDAKTREDRQAIGRASSAVSALAISANATLLAGGDLAGKIRLWELPSGREKRTITAHRGPVRGLALHPAQTHLVSVGRDGRVILWDLSTGDAVKQATLAAAQANALAIMPDGRRFVTGDTTGNLTVWTTAAVEPLFRIQAHQGPVLAVAISTSDPRVLSTGEDGVVRSWDLEAKRQIDTYQAPDHGQQLSVCYSPGSTRALSTGADNLAHLWSLDSHEPLEKFGGHTAAVTCGAFFPSGAVAMTGSDDGTIRIWQLPPPSTLEAKRIEEMQEAQRRLAEKLARFARQMELARQLIERQKPTEAQAELQAAKLQVERDSLEFATADKALGTLSATTDKLTRFADLCRAGKAALDEEKFADALRQFDLARQIELDAKHADEHRKAEDGYELARKLGQLETALAGLKVLDQTLDFAERLPVPCPLGAGTDFAVLLTSRDPPIALGTTPLAWKIEVETPEAINDESVALRLQLVHLATEDIVGDVRHPFSSGSRRQVFTGQAAPRGVWKSGFYELRSSIETPKRKIPRDPTRVEIGTMHWEQAALEIEPEALQQAGYVIDSGIKLERGDAIAVRAEGTVAPAPVQFYRELSLDRKIAQPVAAGPEGLPWADETLRVSRYRPVDTKSNFAALIVRIGPTGTWTAYKASQGAVPSPTAGMVQLSINSLLPRDWSPTFMAKKTTTAAERSYWAAASGAFTVKVRRGRFDFRESLNGFQRAALLTKFKND